MNGFIAPIEWTEANNFYGFNKIYVKIDFKTIIKILSSAPLKKAREKHKNKDGKENYSRIFLNHVCDFSRAIIFELSEGNIWCKHF